MAAPSVIPRRMSKSIKVPSNDTAANSAPTVNGGVKTDSHLIHAQREVELVNHCFADVEHFMGRLQVTAEAKNVLEQQSMKKNHKKKSKKNKKQDDVLLTQTVTPPSEQEFVDIFQKIKYSFCLLDRLKMKISEPTSEELVHHVFIPLHLMVKTTGGPTLAAKVSSPALTSGALSLLQQNLNEQEKQLWMSLGPNWTLPFYQLGETVPPYKPVFLDGWQPMINGQPIEDPIESQYKHEALIQTHQEFNQANITVHQEEHDGMEDSLHNEERMYRCSYDFVARNSSELSVLQGDTLEVLESSKRWWKCKNDYGQIGFVPHNILEPINHAEVDSSNVVMRNQSMKAPPVSPPRAISFYAAPNSSGEKAVRHDPRHHSMPPIGDDGDRAILMNDELLQRLANGRAPSTRTVVINKANDTTAPLDYHSPTAEVQEWLKAKGFKDYTVKSLGVLTGAQLFSLNKEELRAVCPEEGIRVYSQIMMQKALLEDVRKATELEAIMKKQKMKVDLKAEGGEF